MTAALNGRFLSLIINPTIPTVSKKSDIFTNLPIRIFLGKIGSVDELKHNKAVINNIFVSRHPTDRSFFSKNPHFFKSGGRKNCRKSNYRNPLFCRYVILTHGLSKMTATNELYMLSPRMFLLLQAQSHANSLAGAYPRGYGASIEFIKK